LLPDRKVTPKCDIVSGMKTYAWALFVALLSLGPATPGFADVIYSFSGTIPELISSGTVLYNIPESFVYDSPTYITEDTFIAPALLESCSVNFTVSAPPGTFTSSCQGINFLPSSPQDLEASTGLPFDPPIEREIGFLDGLTSENYFFPLDAFTQDGTYISEANPGTLVVSSVPEPASIFFIGTGVALLLIFMFRSSSSQSSSQLQ
jgi:hypothetical protein